MSWYAVHTRSRHEDRVYLGLLQKTFHVFLPKLEVWSKRKDRRKKIMIPMFPGYLFVELAALSEEIRQYIIEVVSVRGGHLASSLGAVEIAIALHYVFDSPRDKILWDVGHQSYAHKILTGRKDAFKNLRVRRGISGFPNTAESEHDAFGVGHASTSISAALGIAVSRDLLGGDHYVISVVGDGAISGGLSFEGINQALDKCPALVQEKILFLPICTPCFTTNQYDC